MERKKSQARQARLVDSDSTASFQGAMAGTSARPPNTMTPRTRPSDHPSKLKPASENRVWPIIKR